MNRTHSLQHRAARTFCLATLALALLPASGCMLWLTPMDQSESVSLLRPIGANSKTIGLEVIAARAPLGDARLNGSLWDAVDEQPIPPKVRTALAKYGIRAGVVSSDMPADLTRLLHLTDEPVNLDPAESDVPIDSTPTVTRRMMTLQSGGRGEYQASPVQPRMTLLLPDGESLAGTTLENAQAVLKIMPTIRVNGKVELDVLPEIQYGQPQQKYEFQDNIPIISVGRPTESFPMLRTVVSLSPGQSLVMTCLPERPGSPGRRFFTESTEGGELQKIVVIRLAQVPRDASFDPGGNDPLLSAGP